MKLKISAAVVCLLLAHPAAAQDVRALAREYIALPAVQDSLLNAMSPEFVSGYVTRNLSPDIKISPEKHAALTQLVTDRFAEMKPALEKSMVDAVASTFTATELEAMIAFVQTEPGASSTRKGPTFAVKYGDAFLPIMQDNMTKLKPEIMQILVQ